MGAWGRSEPGGGDPRESPDACRAVEDSWGRGSKGSKFRLAEAWVGMWHMWHMWHEVRGRLRLSASKLFEEDRRKVVSLLERASAHAASRQDTAGEIAMVVNTFLMPVLLLIVLLSAIFL